MSTCPICGGHHVTVLEIPHPSRSMTSNGGVVRKPLQKASCDDCGHGFHVYPFDITERDQIYDQSYDLSQRDAKADHVRAENYMAHIQSFLALNDIAIPEGGSVVEFGCGSGALIKLAADFWNLRNATGMEAAPTLVAAAQQRADFPVKIIEGFAEDTNVGSGNDLVYSVNVVEHAFNPVSFLSAAAKAIKRTGNVVIICPDGNRAGSELLFWDHVSSFSTASMAHAASRAGLQIAATEALSGQQTGFRIFLLHPLDGRGLTSQCHVVSGISAARNQYLGGWKHMEAATLAALAQKPFAIFGIGEYADLLFAYCPEIVKRAQMFVADDASQSERNEKPVLSTDSFLVNKELCLLAAVHPRSWSGLKTRFEQLQREAVHPYQFTPLVSML